MNARRAILLVMDSFGIGASPDAYKFQSGDALDSGSDTLGHIASAFHAGTAIQPARPLRLPNLQSLGLGESYRISRGTLPAGWKRCDISGHFACAESISTGKDTPSGHWEIAGFPVRFDWTYFPNVPDCFPPPLLAEIFCRSGIPGSIGNRHASGTEILDELGAEHMRTGLPIFYTSADSVFQIACHEESFGLDRLLSLCKTVRNILDESSLKVGRVIARPFIGPGPFQRTSNRHDYAIPPPAPTLLLRAVEAGRDAIGIGKIADIYAHTGITEEVRASGHPDLWKETLAALDRCRDGGLIMTNFVDFDAVFGHRRDTMGYGLALEEFDAHLPDILAKLRPTDLLCLTADHGNDPTWVGTDHTRERVPVLFHSASLSAPRNLGLRHTFADIGQTLARWLCLPTVPEGTAMF